VQDFVQSAPDIIREAARSPLGLLALLVLAVATLALVFFRKSSDAIKLAIFGVFFLAAVSFGIVVASGFARQAGPAAHGADTSSAGVQGHAVNATVTSRGLLTTVVAPGTSLPFWDLDAGRTVAMGDKAADFFFKPSDPYHLKRSKIGVDPLNGARYRVLTDTSAAPWEGAAAASWLSTPSEVSQGATVACVTGEKRYCKFTLRTEGKSLSVRWTTFATH